MIVTALFLLHSVALTWNAYPTAQHFSMYRAKAHAEKYTRKAEPKTNSWLDGAAVSGQTYCYYVTATVKKVESKPSSAVCVTIP